MHIKHLTPLIILLILIGLVFWLDLHSYITFESLKANRKALQAFVKQNWVMAVCTFMSVYIAVIALSIPGGAIMTITGGLMFGHWWGTLIVIISATIGATTLFLIVKHAFPETVAARMGTFIIKMRKGFQDNAFSYLMFLRLIPIFPFVVVNIVPALLGVSFWTFVGATFIGIIPGTFVYSSVGQGISSIFKQGGSFDPSKVLTPDVLIALIGLGILSLLPAVYRIYKKSR